MDGFELQVVGRSEEGQGLAFTNDSWTRQSSGVKLAYQNMRVISYGTYQREYCISILPSSSR
jgi:hypothetical protein